MYARLDLLGDSLDGEIHRGTTNVDIGIGLRQALIKVNSKDRLHLNMGNQGLATRHIEDKGNDVIGLGQVILQRPVQMPNRWIRALGNTARIQGKSENKRFCYILFLDIYQTKNPAVMQGFRY